MRVLVTYSGGKDSQASLIWAVKKFGAKNIQAVFCDTGWEHPVTYQHIQETIQDLRVDLIALKSKKYDGMKGLAEKKGRFPSSQRRFCTEELKSKPMINFVLDHVRNNMIVIQGIRGDESPARSLMQSQCRFFKYYFQHYGVDKKGKKKYHNFRKKEVKTFCENNADDILRPVFEWTGKDVVDYILENGQQPNPLYYEGFKRVGCFPCIMCNHQELRQITERYPDRIDEMIELEERIGTTFFAPNYIPSQFTRTRTLDNKVVVTVRDAVEYIKNKNGTLDMFEPEGPSCMSFYGLCE